MWPLLTGAFTSSQDTGCGQQRLFGAASHSNCFNPAEHHRSPTIFRHHWLIKLNHSSRARGKHAYIYPCYVPTSVAVCYSVCVSQFMYVTAYMISSLNRFYFLFFIFIMSMFSRLYSSPCLCFPVSTYHHVYISPISVCHRVFVPRLCNYVKVSQFLIFM